LVQRLKQRGKEKENRKDVQLEQPLLEEGVTRLTFFAGKEGRNSAVPIIYKRGKKRKKRGEVTL